ncbi:MAG TPA: 23S rRNA (adenine(2503)-C(2))-methyltransferase RlmN [Anaerolineaceae bacterium]|jgi:23S rRNA (adenine2503-C2)-methyltransferase|nr:23S rRNA (adenine(2503)-C(2))-methyltransferase RlmN [Anaerolineaceae bacterium]
MSEPLNISSRVFLFDLNLKTLEELFASWGEPVYRARQLWHAVYVELVPNFEAISTFPKSLRTRLNENIDFSHLEAMDRISSSDQETIKTLFSLPDKRMIEAVMMHYDVRDTLCISSQSGCAMGCVFCATGQMGFMRNLTSGEIVEQVIYYARVLKEMGKKVTNVVVMGMGEPFHNYDAVLAAIDRLNDPSGMNLGARRFTISTVGLVPGIKRFTAEKRQVNLAVSLHAGNDALRASMMPVDKKYPLADLMAAIREYLKTTNRRITFEWALIQGVNDSEADALELVDLIQGMLCHVNVIPLNPTQNFAGKATTRERARAFKETLESRGIPCTIRLRRGIDIQAGCGQLAYHASAT